MKSSRPQSSRLGMHLRHLERCSCCVATCRRQMAAHPAEFRVTEAISHCLDGSCWVASWLHIGCPVFGAFTQPVANIAAKLRPQHPSHAQREGLDRACSCSSDNILDATRIPIQNVHTNTPHTARCQASSSASCTASIWNLLSPQMAATTHNCHKRATSLCSAGASRCLQSMQSKSE